MSAERRSAQQCVSAQVAERRSPEEQTAGVRRATQVPTWTRGRAELRMPTGIERHVWLRVSCSRRNFFQPTHGFEIAAADQADEESCPLPET